MKRLFIILLLFTVGACDVGETGSIYQVTRIVQNNSGYNVNIKSYFNSRYYSKVLEYSIENDNIYVETGEFRYGMGGSSPESDIEWIGTVDSVIVTFDTLRFQKHCTEFVEGCVEYQRRIILDYIDGATTNAGYTRDTSGDLIYIITQDDFDNAEDIGG